MKEGEIRIFGQNIYHWSNCHRETSRTPTLKRPIDVFLVVISVWMWPLTLTQSDFVYISFLYISGGCAVCFNFLFYNYMAYMHFVTGSLSTVRANILQVDVVGLVLQQYRKVTKTIQLMYHRLRWLKSPFYTRSYKQPVLVS